MRCFSRQKGIATLVLAMIVLAVVTIITLFTARVILMDQKIYKNVYGKSAASNAAQAGFDYALGYLTSNVRTITTTNLSSCTNTDSTDYVLSAGTNSPLADNSTFTMTYSCVATNTDTLRITAVGTSFDSAATNTVTALAKALSGAAVIGRADGGGENSVDIQDSSLVYNTNAGATTTMMGGGTVRLRNSAASRTSATSPYGAPYACAASQTMPPAASTNCQDIAYSNATLNAMTNATDFQTNFIGRTISGFSSLATVYNFNCSSNTTFRNSTTFASQGCTNSGTGGTAVTLSAAAASGGIIYINMGTRNLTIDTNAANPSFIIGSASTPVILVINTTGHISIDTASGDTLTIYGNVYTNAPSGEYIRLTEGGTTTLNGILFSSGPVQIRSGAQVNGVVVGDRVDMRTGSSTVYYTPANIVNTYGGDYGSYLTPSYGIVSGSWRDF